VPRESALGVVVRRDAGGTEAFLFGRRSRSSRFMPGNLAFPGGRLDAADRPSEAGAHRRCAAREVLEETGVGIPEDRWIPAGVRVTPPLFPVRFRTEFFVAEMPAGVEVGEPPSDENDWIGFLPAAEVLDRWERGREALPPPVLAVLRATVAVGGGAIADLAETVRRANVAEESAPRIEFVPGIRGLPVKTHTLPPATHTNVWIPAAERFALVDPGSDDPEEIEALLRVARRTASEGSRPAAVLLTHHHRDHVPGAAPVARALGVPVLAHAEVLERVGRRLDGVDARAIAADATLDLGGLTLRAVLTEGHAPGHLAFLVPERAALISGDLVSALSTMLIDPDSGDMDVYLASLRRAAGLGAKTLLPAHGPPIPAIALERAHAHRMEREARVEAALAAGQDRLAALAANAYADTPGAPAFLAERQTLAHLLRLERHGRARRDGDRWMPA